MKRTGTILVLMAAGSFVFSGCNERDIFLDSFDRHPVVSGQQTEDKSEDSEEETDAGSQESSGKSGKSEKIEIKHFPIVEQLPELPTGCEITALTMVLNYYGYDVDKETMAGDYLPTLWDDIYYDEETDTLYGGDLENYFVGDPFSEEGYICGTSAIVTAANTYLEEAGSSMRAVDYSGASPETLYKLVKKGTPVVVWVTIEMEPPEEAEGWYTREGDYMEWYTNAHAAVLIGYTDKKVILADPLEGKYQVSKKKFEKIFEARNRRCVVLE